MAGMRYHPCPVPGCPELRDTCPRHRKVPWAGRSGTTRWAALGVSPRTWKRLCATAKRRDRSTCRRCGQPATAVDHLVPLAWRRPPATFVDHLDVLFCLCDGCHLLKTNREAALGRIHGSPPPTAVIAAHIDWWLSQLKGVSRAAL